MHIRSDEEKDERPKAGEVMIFACVPREDFQNILFKSISCCGVQKAKIRYAVGTFWSASIENAVNESLLKPRDGLELVSAQGELSCKDGNFSHRIDVSLIDKYGRFYQGLLIRGEVKDLVEGIMQFL